MTIEQVEQNRRHYARMLEALPDVWTIESLGSAIAALDALIELLEAPAAEWKNRFRRYWGILEEVNALLLDEGRTVLSFEEQCAVDKAADELRSMIKAAHGPE